jgi:hypothetical protein
MDNAISGGRRGSDRMVFVYLHLDTQPVPVTCAYHIILMPNTTQKICWFEYLIQHYIMKFISGWWIGRWFSLVFPTGARGTDLPPPLLF